MSKAAYPLKPPASAKAAAARLSKQDGVSLNQWIASAAAQKVGAVEADDCLEGGSLEPALAAALP